MARISIIGSGVVGTIVGMGFKELGNDVIFYDIDEKKVEQLKQKGLRSTTDINQVIEDSDISFISVPTPSVDGRIDLSFIKSATENIAKALKNKKNYHTIVIKSTVVPKTTEGVVKPILERVSGKKSGEDFGLCTNPEFLTEIHHFWTDDLSMARDFLSEERIVIGEFDKKSGDILEELYKPLKIPIIRTNLHTAELIKYASNCILASRIIPWYDFKSVCEKLGIDVQFVANIVAMDSRIGKYGSVITGKGYQGKCLPKDMKAFINFAKEIGCNPVLLESVDRINDEIQKNLEEGK